MWIHNLPTSTRVVGAHRSSKKTIIFFPYNVFNQLFFKSSCTVYTNANPLAKKKKLIDLTMGRASIITLQRYSKKLCKNAAWWNLEKFKKYIFASSSISFTSSYIFKVTNYCFQWMADEVNWNVDCRVLLCFVLSKIGNYWDISGKVIINHRCVFLKISCS